MTPIERALFNSYTFETSRGVVGIDRLITMPLDGNHTFTLNQVAKDIYQEHNANEISFVDSPTATNTLLADKLEVVKAVIKYRQDAQAEKASKNQRAQERARLTALLINKKEQAELQLSEKEIMDKLAELDK